MGPPVAAEGQQLLDRQVGGHLAGVAPAHAVGHHEQPIVQRQAEGVLVVGALLARMGVTDGLEGARAGGVGAGFG
jgi:hypothetical protein